MATARASGARVQRTFAPTIVTRYRAPFQAERIQTEYNPALFVALLAARAHPRRLSAHR
jgi:hypothetical protein